LSVRVEIGALRALAARFDEIADRGATLEGAFTAEANVPAAAFGELPPGRQAQADYGQKVAAMSEGLQQVASTLRQFARNLETIASNWQITEDSNNMGAG
jgi:uncharacterized protein YukE